MKQEDVGRKLGYTSGRIGQIQRGEKPGREFIERLIAGFDLPREEWLELAGYGAAPEPGVDETMVRSVEEAMRRMGLAGKSGSQVLFEGILALQAEFNKPVPVWFHEDTKADMSPDQAEAIIRDLRLQMQEEAESIMAT